MNGYVIYNKYVCWMGMLYIIRIYKWMGYVI